jgi:hypothetical protein
MKSALGFIPYRGRDKCGETFSSNAAEEPDFGISQSCIAPKAPCSHAKRPSSHYCPSSEFVRTSGLLRSWLTESSGIQPPPYIFGCCSRHRIRKYCCS